MSARPALMLQLPSRTGDGALQRYAIQPARTTSVGYFLWDIFHESNSDVTLKAENSQGKTPIASIPGAAFEEIFLIRLGRPPSEFMTFRRG